MGKVSKIRHWINKNYKNIIITAFLFPIIIVAIVSISHVTKWYEISNLPAWALYLSVGIEIAAMSALAAIAARMGRKAYFPFIVVTLLQFIGNIYFSYDFIDTASKSFQSWVELVSPILQLAGVEPTNVLAHKRFLALFAGGLLPIISLSFLHMLVRFTEEDRLRDLKIGNDKEDDNSAHEDIIENDFIEEPQIFADFTDVELDERGNLIKKWEDSAILNDLSPMDETSEILDLITPNMDQKIDDFIPENKPELVKDVYLLDGKLVFKEDESEKESNLITNEQVSEPEPQIIEPEPQIIEPEPQIIEPELNIDTEPILDNINSISIDSETTQENEEDEKKKY